jgi:hypothetical protein
MNGVMLISLITPACRERLRRRPPPADPAIMAMPDLP